MMSALGFKFQVDLLPCLFYHTPYQMAPVAYDQTGEGTKNDLAEAISTQVQFSPLKDQ